MGVFNPVELGTVRSPRPMVRRFCCQIASGWTGAGPSARGVTLSLAELRVGSVGHGGDTTGGVRWWLSAAGGHGH